MKKYFSIPVALLAAVIAMIVTYRILKEETKSSVETVPVADTLARLYERKKWEASPDGIQYKKWETSAEGKKVQNSYDTIKTRIKEFADMEAVVTSVTFQRPNANFSSPKWLIVSIDGETYMMQFIPREFRKLSNLKVNDKIIVRSRSAGLSPNHPYLILSGDYIEYNGKVLFQRVFSKTDRC